MAKPVIWTVDDDPEVLRAVERDLRQQYGDRFRVMRAASGEAALEAVKQLKLRNDRVALFLVDQRMPGMTGVEFLEQALAIFPEARRVLLTAYADTDAAIRAINRVKIDHYIMKPWDPPEERLYPVLDDLLEDWLAACRPEFEGIRVVGHRWSNPSHLVTDFLARNLVPYEWLDIETDAAHSLVEFADADPARLPMVLFPDGSRLVEPSHQEIAAKIGLRTRPEQPFYDLVVVGAGPAGLAAAVYGASEGLRTLMIEREAPGGQAGMSSKIENYLGFPVGLTGADLTRRAVHQAQRFGVEMLTAQEVVGLRIADPYRIIELADGSSVSAHAVLVATGVSYRKLDLPGIDSLTGAGVYYGAAMTEALSCRDTDVFIVGGANSAGQAAMFFSRYARSVTMLVRGGSLAKSMSRYLIDRIEQAANVFVRTCTTVLEAHGEGSLEAITVLDAETGERHRLPATALFIFIGALPHTDWLDGVVVRDEHGFLVSGPELMPEGKRPKGWTCDRNPFLLETSVPGVFVAGDVRHGSVKRVASGVGEGSVAVQFIHQYLSKVGAGP